MRTFRLVTCCSVGDRRRAQEPARRGVVPGIGGVDDASDVAGHPAGDGPRASGADRGLQEVGRPRQHPAAGIDVRDTRSGSANTSALTATARGRRVSAPADGVARLDARTSWWTTPNPGAATWGLPDLWWGAANGPRSTSAVTSAGHAQLVIPEVTKPTSSGSRPDDHVVGRVPVTAGLARVGVSTACAAVGDGRRCLFDPGNDRRDGPLVDGTLWASRQGCRSSATTGEISGLQRVRRRTRTWCSRVKDSTNATSVRSR